MISIIWFGLANWAPIFTTFMITLPVVASNLVEGVESVDRRLLEMGDVYRLTGGRSSAPSSCRPPCPTWSRA